MNTPYSGAKGPKTTELPDWNQAYDELFEQHRRLMRVIVGLKAIGRDPGSLVDDLEHLQGLLGAVNQMRLITSNKRHAA